MKNINREKVSALKKAIYEVFKDMDLELYAHEADKFEKNSPVTWDVNWSALGSVEPERARKMAEDLNKAAEIAEFLTSMEITFSYSEDEAIQEMIDRGETERAEEIFVNYVEQFKVGLETKCEDLIK